MGKNERKKNRHLISGRVSDGGVGGGNGIVGLVMFGGTLAVATFISFVVNKNRTKGAPATQKPSLDDGCKSQDNHDTQTQGLRALLQPPTTPPNHLDISCHGETETETHMKSINHTCIAEEKIDPVPADLNTISEVVQEIVLSDDSNQESAIEEECLAPLFNSQDSQAQDVELEHHQESLQFIETEKQDDDDAVSEITEEEDGSSKEILNSKEKPQEGFSLEGDGGKIDFQNEEHEEAKTDNDAANEKGNFSMVLNDQPWESYSFQQIIWLIPMLLPGLLLLLVLLLLINLIQQFFVL